MDKRQRHSQPRHAHGFTLIELLVVLAVIAILAAILFPVFGSARASSRQSVCLSNVKQAVLAAVMYAQDNDETFPRLDNNGACFEGGEVPCDAPGWADARLAKGGLEDSKVMFFNVLQPYMKGYQIGYCPEIGPTDWKRAVGYATRYGINWGGPYDPRKEEIYYGSISQMAINALTIEINNKHLGWPFANSQLSAIARPSQNVLFVAESVWDWEESIEVGLGNTAVWPARNGTPCWDGNNFTWFIHRGKREGGASWYLDPDRVLKAPPYQGLSNVAFSDGHAKAYKYTSLDRCEYEPTANVWIYTLWDPRW